MAEGRPVHRIAHRAASAAGAQADHTQAHQGLRRRRPLAGQRHELFALRAIVFECFDVRVSLLKISLSIEFL